MLKQIVTASLLVIASSAYAQHDHEEEGHGDIEGGIVGSQIIIAGGEAVAAGGHIYEGDFGDAEGGPYETDAPGFDIDGFNLGEILAFNVVGPLQYWDGSSWGTASTGLADSGTVSIFDAQLNTFDVSGASVLEGLVAVGDADVDGEVHQHIEFSINAAAATGSYLFEIALFGYDSLFGTELYDANEPVYITLNNGLSEVAFESSVDAFANPVPVPAAWLFMASALGSLFLGRRSKS